MNIYARCFDDVSTTFMLVTKSVNCQPTMQTTHIHYNHTKLLSLATSLRVRGCALVSA